MPSEDQTASVPELVSQSIQEAHQQTAETSTEAPARSPEEAPELPEYLSHVDPKEFAALPEKQQQQVLKMGKELYGDYQKKTTDVARQRDEMQTRETRVTQLEGILNDMDADPAMKDRVQRAYYGEKAGVKETTATTKLEQLMNEANPEQRDGLRRLVDAVRDEVASNGASQKKVAELERKIQDLVSGTQLSRQSSLESSIDKITPAYQPIVEKYRAAILRMGVASPSLSLTKLMQLVSTDGEYKQAVLADGQKQTTKEVTRAKEVAAPGQTASAATGAETALTDRDIIKSRDHRFGDRRNLGDMMRRILPDVRRGMPKT